jgi:hypothetical protein
MQKEFKMMRSIGFSVLMATASLSFAGEIEVEGNTSVVNVFQSTNTSTAAIDKIAVYGKSDPLPNWGIGADFTGGYIGVAGRATKAGTGIRYAGYFTASGGTTGNYGVYANASGTSALAGMFGGNVSVTGTVTQTSDARLKENVKDLSGSLHKLMGLKPKSYQFKRDSYPKMNLASGDQFGLLAQDLEAVFPQLVQETAVPPDVQDKETTEKFKSVNYIGLIPVLIKAMQEQQEEIAALKLKLEAK